MKNLWGFITSMCSNYPFLTGFVLGVIGCAVAILVFRFCFRLFGSPKVSSFSYPVANGQITIRAAAVTNLIFTLGKEFPEFVVIEAGLHRKGGLMFIRVVVDYRQGRRMFSEVVSLFQRAVLDKLKEILGVENIKKVEVRMRDSIPEPGRPRG